MNAKKSTREELFDELKNHAWFGRLMARMRAADLELARAFLRENAELSKGDFEFKLNRWCLDQPKPKHWKELLELMACANSMEAK